MTGATSFPKIAALPKHRVSALLSAGWARVAARVGKGRLADGIEATEKTVENAMSGRTVPELHTALASLAVDPTALDELLAGYGVRLAPLHAEAANDLQTAAGVVNAMGALIARLADGVRCHNDTLAVGSLLRPHMPALTAIVSEADQLRGAA
jgi:hypothetical protein